ncbi:MAG: glycosyltransferase 87 family protein, partial [Microgenomates group bacterium]
ADCAVVYFLLKKKFKVFVFGLVSMAILFLASGLVFGFNLWREYFTKVVPATFEIGRKYIYYNQAASGFFSRVINNGNNAAIATIIFSFLVLAVTLSLLLRQKEVDAFGYSLVISTILLINSFSWQHHFVWLVFPFLTVFAYLRGHSNRKLQVLTVVAYLLVAFNIKKPELFVRSFFGKILLSHVFWGNLLLWLLLMFLICKDEKIFP